MVADDFADARRPLVWHEAAGDFGACPGRHDGFAARALITAGQAVDFKRRPRTALLERCEPAFAEQFFHTDQFLEFGGCNRQALELFPLVSRKRRNVVVETGNGNATVFVTEFGEQLAQGHRRVVQRAAENAGMQVARRAVHRDFKGDDAAQRIRQRRMIGVWHAGVGNDDGVAEQLAPVRFEKFREVRTADFFFAFDDKREVAGQGGAGFQIGFDGFEMREVLAFVVGGAAGKNRAALDARREWRRCPLVDRVRRLHVVMAIDHEVRLAGRTGSRCPGQHDGMAIGRANPCVEADVAAVLREPFGAREHVCFVLRLRGDAGKTEECAQLSHKPGLVAFQIIEHDLHGHQLILETPVCQAEPSGK